MRNKFAKAISVAASALISLSFFSAFPAAAEDSGNNIEDTLTDGMFKYELLDDGTYTITGYDATSISTIPSTRNGKAITASFLRLYNANKRYAPQDIAVAR